MGNASNGRNSRKTGLKAKEKRCPCALSSCTKETARRKEKLSGDLKEVSIAPMMKVKLG
jgi:hypothetical protein